MAKANTTEDLDQVGEENVGVDAEKIKAELDALKATYEEAQTKIEAMTVELAKTDEEKQAIALELAELKAEHTKRAADALAESRDVMLVSTGVDGKEFWRAGILFNGEWREVKRAEVGEKAWAAICAEPALQRKVDE
nr:MAG TPA: hypothetical protein [Caudoviricetes sp.]